MPVSFIPVIVPLLLVVVPVVLYMTRGPRTGLIAAMLSISFVVAFLGTIFVPGWRLEAEAERGNPKAQYRLAKWHCSHHRKIAAFLYWPFPHDPLLGYSWLQRAAAQDFPPALYALGVKLKYGSGVPRPADWSGPAGNVFEQPEKGQTLIDRALELGYMPIVEERSFLYHVFCGSHVEDPHG